VPLTRIVAVAAAAAAVLALVAVLLPEIDGSERAGAAPGSSPAPAPAKPSAVKRYEAVRRRGAVVAVLKRPVSLRAQPRRSSRRVARIAKLRTEWRSPRVLAVSGRRGRWLRVIATELPNGHRAWIPISAARFAANPWRVRADLSSHRVTVLRGGRVVRSFDVAIGAPGSETPTGKFAVTDKINMRGHTAYGCCALALSGHQPKISQGWSGGDRLAIHGTHYEETIGSAASNGCLRARDPDARFLIKRVALGTIVEVRA
jgi:lipoprotein-anchoring transpeptidase ErfK/SrfK